MAPVLDDRIFRTAFEESVVGLALTTPDGRWAHVNRCFCEMLGYAPEELAGKRIGDVTHPEDAPKDAEAIEALLAGQIPFHDREKRYLHKSGRVVWVRLTTRLVRDEAGRPQYFNSTVVDISDRKRAEKALEEHRAMMTAASKMSALGEMAAGVAHEINNPLTIIHGIARELKRAAKKGPVPAESVVRSASQVESTVMRISRIVRALHSFARDSRQDPFEIVTIGSIVDDTIAICKSRFRRSKVALLIDGDLDTAIECRPVQISQVLLNLLNNAHDAVESQPEKWVRIAVVDGEGELEVRVTDSGPGVPETIAARLFQPFFTTKPPGRGTGLGLSVSRGIAESHRGRLRMDARERATFVLTLPKWQSEEALQAA